MAKGSKAAALVRPSRPNLGQSMSDEKSSQQRRSVRDRSVSKRVLAHNREVLLARMCLRLCEIIGSLDTDQELLWLYNDVKPIAESTLRK